MKTNNTLLLCGAALLAAPFATAATLISWGPTTDYVAADQSSQRALSGGVLAFDLNTPLSPLSANYSGGDIYGGVTATGVSGVSNLVRVLNNNAVNGGGNDVLLFGKASSSVLGDRVTGVFLWKQSDFLAGSGVSDSVTLSSLSYTGRVNPGTATGAEARWIIQQGSSYMISSNVTLTASVAAHPTSDLSSLSWFSYDPLTSMTSIGSAIVSPTFDAVTAAGVYLTAVNGAATGGINIALSAFSAEGTVSAIPEPSTAASLLGFGALAWAARRRGQHRSAR